MAVLHLYQICDASVTVDLCLARAWRNGPVTDVTPEQHPLTKK